MTIQTLKQQLREKLKKDRDGVIIFDLDDTLFDSRTRTQKIFRDFSQTESNQNLFPNECLLLSNIHLSQIHYGLKKTLYEIGIHCTDFLSLIEEFWNLRFFSNEYVQDDHVIPGAVSFVSDMHGLGAHIIYLTGRDQLRMSEGTVYALKKNRFPFDNHAHLSLKPDAKDNDFAFKNSFFEELKKSGTNIIAGFDNEPQNLLGQISAYPSSIAVHLNTLLSTTLTPTLSSHPDFLQFTNFLEDL